QDTAMTQHIRWILILAIVALMMRLALLLALGGLDENLYDSMADQYTYLDIARSLAAGKGFSVSTDTWLANAGAQTSIFPPLYPLFVALSFHIFGESLVPIRLLHVLLSLIVVIAVYGIGLCLFDKRTAIIAGLMTALYPALAIYVRPIMSEGLFYP